MDIHFLIETAVAVYLALLIAACASSDGFN